MHCFAHVDNGNDNNYCHGRSLGAGHGSLQLEVQDVQGANPGVNTRTEEPPLPSAQPFLLVSRGKCG